MPRQNYMVSPEAARPVEVTFQTPDVATALKLKKISSAYEYYSAPEILRMLMRKGSDVAFKELQAQKNSSDLSNGQMPWKLSWEAVNEKFRRILKPLFRKTPLVES